MFVLIIQIKQDSHEPQLGQRDWTWCEFQSCLGDIFGRTSHLVVIATEGKMGGKETCFSLESEDTMIEGK